MNSKVIKKRAVRQKKEKDAFETLSKAAEVAYYYGFTPLSPLKIDEEDHKMARSLLEMSVLDTDKPLTVYPEEKVALLRKHLGENSTAYSQPLMLYHESVIGGRKKAVANEKRFYLDIIGTTKSIAEAVIFKTAIEILREEGFDNLLVELNSIGDKESTSRFVRELTQYYKKNLGDLPAHCRQTFKTDPFEVLLCKNEKCQELKENAPHSISSLSENGRRHFGEVLEYLEVLKIPYKINTNLLHTKKLCLGTIFEIKDANTDTPVAFGLRYNGLSKKLGFKKELGAIGIFGCYKKEKSALDKKAKVFKSPKIYFIQLGFNAKLKSLEVIEILRKQKIPLAQGLIKDKLAPQLQIAENNNIPYTIIMGQKEAMENTVIFRDMATRSQETVAISALPEYLKKMKFRS
jgi:histidyl-tRNA synthetase